MPFNAQQIDMHEIISRNHSLLMLEVPPGSGKTFYAGLRAAYQCSRGVKMMIVTSDRELRSAYVRTNPEDVKNHPEEFPDPGDLAIKFVPLYAKSEVVQGRKVIDAWLKSCPWMDDFTTTRDLLLEAATFFDTGAGRVWFRTDIESDAGFITHLGELTEEERDAYLNLYYSGPKKDMPAWILPHVGMTYARNEIPVVTFHKFIYDVGMTYTNQIDHSRTISFRDEIIVDEAHELVRIGQAFTDYEFNLTRFRDILVAAVLTEPLLNPLMLAARNAHTTANVFLKASKRANPEIKEDSLPTLHRTIERLCQEQDALSVPDRSDPARKEKKALAERLSVLMNSHFWSLFDGSTAKNKLWFSRIKRRVVYRDGNVYMQMSGQNPGAIFRSLIVPKSLLVEDQELPRPRLILMSGTMFMVKATNDIKKAKENFARLLGLYKDEYVAERIKPDKPITKIRLVGSKLDKIFGPEQAYREYMTRTTDTAIQSWVRDVLVLRPGRVAVHIVSWADGYRIRDGLIATGIDPSDIILSNRGNFQRAVELNPNAILLTTKTNGFNLIEPDGTALLTRLVLTRLPHGRVGEHTVKVFVGWTRALQFIGRGMRGNGMGYPELTISSGDSRFSSTYFPSAWFSQ